MLFSCYMKSIKDIRLENLRTLVNEAGGRHKFCERAEELSLDIKYSYIGQMMAGSCGIGDATALKLEKIGNKPKYWLDQDWQGIQTNSAGGNPRDTLINMIKQAEDTIIQFSKENEIEFTRDQIYDLLLQTVDFAGRQHFSSEFVKHYVIELAKKLKNEK